MAKGNLIYNEITTSSELDSISKKPGQLLFTTDDRKLYLDISSTERLNFINNSNEEINLLIGADSYTYNSPIIITPTRDDYHVYYDNNIYADVTKGKTYLIICETNGFWDIHSPSETDKKCTFWLTNNNTHSWHYCFTGSGAETGLRTWTFTAPATERITIRLNAYGADNTPISFWNIKLIQTNYLSAAGGFVKGKYEVTGPQTINGSLTICQDNYPALSIGRNTTAYYSGLEFYSQLGILGGIGMNKINGDLDIIDGQQNIKGTILDTTNYSNYALPLTGGALSGTLSFPSVSSGNSYGLSWTGSTDGAQIFYNVESSDAGRLVFNMIDDSNTRIDFKFNGTLKSYIDYNGTYNGNASSASQASALSKNDSLVYGGVGLQWFDLHSSVGTAANANQNPFDDWFHHIRMNHANNNGYYVDLAACFHSDDLCMRRVVSGSGKEWVTFLHSGNYTSYAQKKITYGTASPSGGSSGDIYIKYS